MRMRMFEPKYICDMHLRGEYYELFKVVGSLKKQRKLDGYFDHNCLEIKSIWPRYLELKEEMILRGFKPKKPLSTNYDISYLGDKANIKVDRILSFITLMEKCADCRKRLEQIRSGEITYGKPK